METLGTVINSLNRMISLQNLLKPNCRVILLVDASDSMVPFAKKMVKELNHLLESQKNKEKEESSLPKLSIVFFNTKIKLKTYKNLSECQDLTCTDFQPHSLTALYDAIGETLEKFKNEHGNIIYVLTDGEENASVRYRSEHVKKMVSKLQNDKDWLFQFYGGFGDDKFVQKYSQKMLNISDTRTFNCTEKGLTQVYTEIGKETKNRRRYMALKSKQTSKIWRSRSESPSLKTYDDFQRSQTTL